MKWLLIWLLVAAILTPLVGRFIRFGMTGRQ